MNKAILDKFGELLMTRVRDKAIGDWEKILSGEMRGQRAERLRAELTPFEPAQLEVIRRLLPDIVDTTLHHLLWMLEQERSADLICEAGSGVKESVRDSSDGLTGELYGKNGWVAQFSHKPQGHFI